MAYTPQSKAARTKKQINNALETYRISYALPFWRAYRDKQPMAVLDRLSDRSHAFRLGLHMANPHGQWHKKCEEIDKELMDLMGIKEDDNG